MHRDVLVRRNRVIKYIQRVRELPIRQRSHESMCSCYVYTFGALEYMLETLIRGWIQSRVKQHKSPYKGKKSVDAVIKALEQLAESNLKANNGIKYSTTCELIEKLAGTQKKDMVKSVVDALPGGSAALGSAIARIETMRHNIAHGALWPDETSPNLDDLENDFLFIYNGLIVAINQALPRY